MDGKELPKFKKCKQKRNFVHFQVAFCSWSAESTLRKHSCNNMQIGRCTPAKVRAMKSANCWHLQLEQLLKAS